MSIKDILLVMDCGQAAAHRIDLAATLAARWDAHLTGLYACPDLLPFDWVMPEIPVSQALRDAALAADTRNLDDTRSLFDAGLERHGIRGTWRDTIGPPGLIIGIHARTTDLIVTGQRDEVGRHTALWLPRPEDVIADSGRPAIVVPYTGTHPQVGRHVMIAWNGSREAARAVHDALPLLESAERVTVAVVNPGEGWPRQGWRAPDAVDDRGLSNITCHLARHGVRIEIDSLWSDGGDPAGLLLSRSSDIGADMMVAGCYGYSRLREYLLGGTSRGLLRHMTLPILMAH